MKVKDYDPYVKAGGTQFNRAQISQMTRAKFIKTYKGVLRSDVEKTADELKDILKK